MVMILLQLGEEQAGPAGAASSSADASPLSGALRCN